MINSINILLLITLLINHLRLETGFPVWLKDKDTRTDQTSGITFISASNSSKTFLVCDDIGDIYRLKLSGTIVNLEKIKFSKDAENFLRSFIKPDFEEIVFDRDFNEVLVSIEGNGLNFRNEAGIYKLVFENNDITKSEITSIEKINFKDWKIISKYIEPNIGFEGFAVSKNRYFLGLEGFQFGNFFLDSTILYVVDKISRKVIREISTSDLKIHTITGLYAINDFHILGIDRNNQNIFEILFNQDYSIKECKLHKMDLPVPKLKNHKYTASIESISLDNENYVYVVDDPWRKFYVPSNEILRKLPQEDRRNYKDFIPLLFKFKIN